jgi:carbonic anhydrase
VTGGGRDKGMTRRIVRRFATAAFCVSVLVACGGSGPTPSAPVEPAWNHDPDDASLGPTAWGSIDQSFEACRTGTSQSPVDIAGTVEADLPPLSFDYEATPLVVENTGHTVEVPMPEGSEQTLTVGEGEYRLDQYHFHAPSEHTLDGESFDAEAHLVHENDDGEIAVVGVSLEVGAPTSELFDAVLTNAPQEAAEKVEAGGDRSPIELLPGGQVTRYYSYPGSLTTPGCDEGVRWFVLEDALGVSATAVERLHELIAGLPGYDGYENNNRPTQPLNDRVIQRSSR